LRPVFANPSPPPIMSHDAVRLLTQPLVFEPLFMERVWGGRRLEQIYRKKLPPGARIGESWELVDREEAQSVVHDGPLRGETLHELWTHQREPIFGAGWDGQARFPLLFKMLDARERLSLQVHPPAGIAGVLGGEPKHEMWYLAHAEAGADLYAGLTGPVSRTEFEEALYKGRAADLIHRLPVEAGDAIEIPSGRIHAIGAGCLIVEIQQNSDTTYRVFDWNRVGMDGSPRTLHVEESLQSTDFDDIRPGLQPPVAGTGTLVESAHFRVERWVLDGARAALEDAYGRCAVFACLEGKVESGGAVFSPGDFFLAPACLPELHVHPLETGTTLLRTTIPRPE
jgi:mannose-6-phosphate isomerase